MNTNSKTEIIALKFPINISKLIPREMKLSDSFSSVKTKVYDITCFSSVKFHLGQTSREISKELPDYEYKIYAYRATKRCVEDNIGRLKLLYKYDHTKRFVHINVEMLPPQEDVEMLPPLLIPQPLDASSISDFELEEVPVRVTQSRRQLNTDE
jgi:hypothetical protein